MLPVVACRDARALRHDVGVVRAYQGRKEADEEVTHDGARGSGALRPYGEGGHAILGISRMRETTDA